jgi:hypothetical protein
MAYLAALGVETYVSRGQLPGAAPSRRLVRVPKASPPDTPAADLSGSGSGPTASAAQERRPAPVVARLGPVAEAGVEQRSGSPREAASASAGDVEGCRFTLVAIVAGGLLWLEELQDTPLAGEQVALVRAMARAVAAGGASDPEPAHEITQFTWPMHDNPQFDQGEAAAMAALGSFLRRKLEQHRCRGIIALGDRCARRIPVQGLPSLARETLPGTRDMLGDSRLKREAWNVLAAVTTAS